MRHVLLTIAAGDLDDVLDRLLPLIPQGVHEFPAGEDRVELGIYGDAPELDAIALAAGAALFDARESEVGDDPAQRRLAAFERRPPIGGRVVVRPEGAPAAGPGLLDVIVEDAGGAFGVGTHPTTVMCLELLLGLRPGGAFADLGCGTGVLAITAVKLGWAPAVALDHELTAVHAAQGNARRNGVDVDVLRGDLMELPPPPVPTLAANVPEQVHARIAARLAPETARVIVSGIVEEQLPAVLEGYGRAGLTVAGHGTLRGWTAALLVRDG
jgi:ribosomal protein L11 methyltransferase